MLRNHRHCRKNPTMPSANRLHQLKAPSKVIPIKQASLKLPLRLDNPELSLLHQMTSLRTTLPIRNSEIRTRITTINSTDLRGKVLKVSRMVQLPSSAHSVGTMVLNQKGHLSSHKALRSKLHLAMPLLERVKTAVTPLPTHLLSRSNQGLAKAVLNPSPVHNNPALIHMGIHTSPAHIMLRT